jgi:hypothetical protein
MTGSNNASSLSRATSCRRREGLGTWPTDRTATFWIDASSDSAAFQPTMELSGIDSKRSVGSTMAGARRRTGGGRWMVGAAGDYRSRAVTRPTRPSCVSAVALSREKISADWRRPADPGRRFSRGRRIIILPIAAEPIRSRVEILPRSFTLYVGEPPKIACRPAAPRRLHVQKRLRFPGA